VNVRKFVVRASTLDDLCGLGTLTRQAARFLDAAVAAGLNVVLSGGTQAGKTTLLNCLASSIPASERVVSCEEVFELRLSLPDWVPMQTRQPNLEGTGAIGLRRLVRVEPRLGIMPVVISAGLFRSACPVGVLIAPAAESKAGVKGPWRHGCRPRGA
jgi:pilus assembly protein CpaF